jgi:ABC-type transport system involved in multi-copper enzyme maturation permease subunit
MSLIKSEVRKVLYVRANWGILLASVVISIISVVITPFILEAGNVGGGLTLDSPQAIDAVYANAISGYIFVIILGIMLMAGEYRHGTAVATFLARPKREVVLAAKLGIAAIVGAVFMLISVWTSIFAGIIVLATFDNAAAPSSSTFLNLTIAGLISGAILAIIGVAIGALLKSQMLAIVFSLVYLFVIDPLLLVLWVDIAKYLPGGLITAMTAVDIDAPELGINTANFLDPIQATLLLLGYGAVFALTSLVTSMRRDVE